MSQWKVTALSNLTSVWKIHTRSGIALIFTNGSLPWNVWFCSWWFCTKIDEIPTDNIQVMWNMKCVQYRWYLWQPPHNCVNIKVFVSALLECKLWYQFHNSPTASVQISNAPLNLGPQLNMLLIGNLETMIILWYLTMILDKEEWTRLRSCVMLHLFQQDNSLTYMIQPRILFVFNVLKLPVKYYLDTVAFCFVPREKGCRLSF